MNHGYWILSPNMGIRFGWAMTISDARVFANSFPGSQIENVQNGAIVPN